MAIGLAAILALSSCGEDEGPGSGMTAAQHNEEGWGSYLLGDYADARSHFSDALGLDPNLVEARLGLAWSEAQEGKYPSAVRDFDQVLASGVLMEDAFAGRAAAALEVPDDSLAVASAESTLARDVHYFFNRRPEYNFYDLRLILAQAYFALSRYSEAQDQVDILDPDNGLDPADSESWVVGGTGYPTYEASLAVLIEHLWAFEGAYSPSSYKTSPARLRPLPGAAEAVAQL
jgi:tetratricopeptide (TPR) repeat protein